MWHRFLNRIDQGHERGGGGEMGQAREIPG